MQLTHDEMIIEMFEQDTGCNVYLHAGCIEIAGVIDGYRQSRKYMVCTIDEAISAFIAEFIESYQVC